MAFVTGLIITDAPASALNNLGSIPGERTDNTTGVKTITARDGSTYVYVSAQAYRYWWRTTLEKRSSAWKAAPIYREEKIAYTDANPLHYWDDDIFGYMRAPSSKESAKAKRAADASRANETPTNTTITRVAPLRVGTLVSVAPVRVTQDFGTMSRQENDPVPHEHQFYRTALRNLFSLDLHAVGTFSYRNRTGFHNLDETRIEQAKNDPAIEHVEAEHAYRLPRTERARRIAMLFDGLAHLEGGAKQTLHYTDVSPALVIAAVTKGGNHIFGHITGANSRGEPVIKTDALNEALTVFADDLLSPVYVGWVRGYLDDERAKFEKFVADTTSTQFIIGHPREVMLQLAKAFEYEDHAHWLD